MIEIDESDVEELVSLYKLKDNLIESVKDYKAHYENIVTDGDTKRGKVMKKKLENKLKFLDLVVRNIDSLEEQVLSEEDYEDEEDEEEVEKIFYPA